MPPPALVRRPWGWFAAWAVLGGGLAFGVLAIASVGLLVLPVVLAAMVVAGRRSQGRGALGAVSGVGLPVLYVAYLNRGGPGNVCTLYRGGGQSCLQEWSPWPWVAVGMVLVVAGLAVFGARRPARSRSQIG